MENVKIAYGDFISAEIVADSINQYGNRLTTFCLRYPRAIHGELMTHRVFSRNAASSRAIPIQKMLDQVRNSPFEPIYWGKNQPGMQAKEELQGDERQAAIDAWVEAAKSAADFAEKLMNAGAHKQIGNRILEPWQIMQTIVSATDFDNFFELRDHEDAEPHFQALAKCMRAALSKSTPVKRTGVNDWHLPYISPEERSTLPIETLLACSTARCARVSYLTHEGKIPNVDDDIKLHERLVGSAPIHASPTEHQAMPSLITGYVKNFNGWIQYRAVIESNYNRDI